MGMRLFCFMNIHATIAILYVEVALLLNATNDSLIINPKKRLHFIKQLNENNA